jgi:hypothetical protein
MNEDYEIVAVESAEAPDDQGGADWYRYTISQGTNKIFGYRRGDLHSITKSVQELVLRLNERRVGKRGRTNLYMSSRGKPAASK